MAMKELREALYFACTVEFWRMAVLWTLSLIISYLHLAALTYFSPNSGSYTRCSPPLVPPPGTSTSTASAHRRPVCVITGATFGLGAAAADAFSREGFFVVLEHQMCN